MKLVPTALSVAALAATAAAQCGGSAEYADANKDACGASEAAYTVTNASYDRHNHNDSMSGSTIVDIAAGNDQFSTLVAAVQAAGLADALKGDGPFTVFAPTNAAFGKLPEGTVDTLLKPENRHQLQQILTFHVVQAELPAARVIESREATTLQGQRVDIMTNRNRDGSVAGVTVNGADVVQTDIRASNGVIHVIDEVIMPETQNAVEVAQELGQFGTLLAAARAAGLADTLANNGPITILAPSDEAFDKLPRGTVQSLLRPENRGQLREILTYHVIEGRVYDDQVAKMDTAGTLQGGEVRVGIVDGRLMINDAKVVASDVESSNAVIHVIDSVLLPR